MRAVHNFPLRDEPQLMLDINTTPLIDVMLVLLIMLIITIPAQLHSLNLNMSQRAHTSPPPPHTNPVPIRVAIDHANAVSWNDQAVSKAQLAALLHAAAQQVPQPQLHIHADGHARYDTVASVMASVQRSGLTQMGFVGIERFAR